MPLDAGLLPALPPLRLVGLPVPLRFAKALFSPLPPLLLRALDACFMMLSKLAGRALPTLEAGLAAGLAAGFAAGLAGALAAAEGAAGLPMVVLYPGGYCP